MEKISVVVTVNDRNPERDSNDYKGKGTYYSNGALKFAVKVPDGYQELEIDPSCFNEDDPKRCIRDSKWSKWRIKSILFKKA